MAEDLPALPTEHIEERICTVRGQRVMLDSDLAAVYAVETRALIQAIKRNAERFPADFIFQLSESEWDSLRSQIVISKGKGGRRYPYEIPPADSRVRRNLGNNRFQAQY